ncbi:hypothetical protein KW787_03320 [Candidatus Pacearchaeota archaeon]|nr:hypothetical protein [Candidatus Pacearchaeota archaeon]
MGEKREYVLGKIQHEENTNSYLFVFDSPVNLQAGSKSRSISQLRVPKVYIDENKYGLNGKEKKIRTSKHYLEGLIKRIKDDKREENLLKNDSTVVPSVNDLEGTVANFLIGEDERAKNILETEPYVPDKVV